MTVELVALVFVLIAALIGVAFWFKHRVILHEPGPPDVRPDDRLPTADPDLTNPPISQPEFTHEPWAGPRHHL